MNIFHDANVVLIHDKNNWFHDMLDNVKDDSHDKGILIIVRPGAKRIVMNLTYFGNYNLYLFNLFKGTPLKNDD